MPGKKAHEEAMSEQVPGTKQALDARRKKILDSPLHSIQSKSLSNQSDMGEEDQDEMGELQISTKKVQQSDRLGSENFPDNMTKELRPSDMMAIA